MTIGLRQFRREAKEREHQENVENLLSLTSRAPAYKALYRLTTGLKSPDARCKISWGLYGYVMTDRASQAPLRVGEISRVDTMVGWDF